jgi:lysozyme family protein
MTFDDMLDCIFGSEGGYDGNPLDPGNWTGGAVGAGVLRGTKFGIAAASFPTLDIAGLTQAQAAAIYRFSYYNKIGGDSLPPPVGLLIFDCAVNQGDGAAARLLQTSVSADADGVVGPATIAATNRAYSADSHGILREIAARRALRYATTGNLDAFGLGWMRRLARVFDLALAAVVPHVA